MQVEVFSDVVCPWCYIGKRNLDRALARFPHADDVTVVYRSYQLAPHAPKHTTKTTTQMLAAKYGVTEDQARAMNARVTDAAAQVGLEYHLEKASPANTFDAHRLLHFAAAQARQAQLKERLLAAYFTEGKRIGDVDVLIAEAEAVGLDGDIARAVLSGDDFADEVNADFSLARAFGITGVPFFVIDRKFGLSGAQPASTLQQTLEEAWLAAHPLVSLDGPSAVSPDAGHTAGAHAGHTAGGNCADGVCRV